MTEPVPTASFPRVQHILDLLIDGLMLSLPERLIGIYLYGSLITGDFDLAISDIDLVIVLAEDLDELGFAALDHLHSSIVQQYPEWHDRLELAYISNTALKTFRAQTSTIGIISPGEPFHFVRAGQDWLISWYALRKHGLALLGPPIQELLDPISLDDYIAAVREHIESYRTFVKTAPDKSFLSYIVLTVARGVYTIDHRRPTSKIKAAAWAKLHYPQWANLIKQALSWRADPHIDSLTTERIRPQVEAYVDDMLSQPRALDSGAAEDLRATQ